MVLSLIAGLAGALAILTTIFLVIGTISPVEAGVTWVIVALLFALWLSGIWWRWDSPDRREPGYERERRGF